MKNPRNLKKNDAIKIIVLSQCLRVTFLVMLVGSSLFALDETAESFSGKSCSYAYAKVGTEAGLGYRYHQNAHGFDISADLILLALDNWFSVKGIYLHYPFYEQKRYFYIGAGVGAVNEFGESGNLLYPAFEGILGYEFRSEKRIKTFLQLEAGIPFSRFSQYAELPIIPAFTFGFGF